jgi:putative tricarboxylic transport membrane protein
VVLFLFGVITVLLSLRLPIGTFRAAGSGLFPLLLGLLLMLLAGLYLARLWLRGDRMGPARDAGPGVPAARMQLTLFLGAMLLATLLYNPLGYPLNSFLLMLALLRILGIRRWRSNLLISIATAVASYVLFVRWLDIPLPKGWIGL